MARSLLCLIYAVVGAAAVASAPSVRAQSVPSQASMSQGFPRQLVPRFSQTDLTALALEGAVDPRTYIVGPGDVFGIAIGGSVPRQFTASVAADGQLLLPEAGSFDVADRLLGAVRAEVRAALRNQFRNVSTEVSLVRPRQFFVHVSGAVDAPGRQLVGGVARVEDALSAAMADPPQTLAQYATPVDSPNMRWPALRNVRVEHRDGSAISVDLMRYFSTGDTDANPFLRDGDTVHLPMFDPLTQGIVVQGAVDLPGTYDARPGDTARDLLVVSAGEQFETHIARIRRARPRPGDASETVEVAASDAATLDVQAGDQLYAVPILPNAARAEVYGAVQFPGIYPITAGETTIDQLVTLAGGLRPDALVRGAYLERPSRSGVIRGASPVTGADAPLDPAQLADTSPTEGAAESGILGGLLSRQFYIQQTERTPRVSLNPDAALRGSEPIPLREGDRLMVPFDRGLVRVYGRVVQGGYVPYVAGATAGDYVARAGGVSASATEVYVVDGATRQFTEGRDATVLPGDAVFVNSLPAPDSPAFAQIALQERADDRAARQERRQATFQLIQTVVGITGTVASLVLAYVTLSN